MIRTLSIYTLVLFITLATGLGTYVSAQESIAEKRAREVVDLICKGDREEIKKYVNENFGDQMKEIPMEGHLKFFLSNHDSSRGFEIVAVQDVKPTSSTLLLKNKLTAQWDAISVSVEDKAPYLINGIGFREPKPPTSQTKPVSDKDMVREMRALMKKLVDADIFSGTVLLAKNGQRIFEGAYGAANKDFDVPNKIDTKFNLGSMNKMFTAVAIAQLVERGKLSFDDPLSKFIPDFPDAESAKKIKIKNLLSHTAGLGGYFTKRFQDTSRANLRTIDDMMRLAKQDEKLQFEPGTKWQYSNTGMLVLGKVIEIITGQTYYDYVRENIYKPAGMENTDCYELDQVTPNLAIGYDKEFTEKGVVWSNNIFEHVMRGGPQGGGYSTVGDLLKFDQALRSGKLVGMEYVKILTTAKPELNSPRYGYGFETDTATNKAGHSGGFTGISSNLSMYLGSGWTAIVMSNYSGASFPVSSKMNSLIAANESSKNGVLAK